jgi:hypothetical protein
MVSAPKGYQLPTENELLNDVQALIEECRSKSLFNPEIEWTIKAEVVKKKEAPAE